ncbi:MAG: pilus assembly protein PilM [Ruminococcus sp.]|nr:pilus assembly protein PilM [Ruminococcus sp.]
MAKIKSVIGFEVDTAEIRAIELTKSNGAYSVLACGKIPLPEGTIEEGFIRNADEFNKALAELLQNGNFKSNDVVVGVNNENVIMRYASFPKVPEDKLRNMVLLQAQEFIPIPVQEMEIDYVIAGESLNDEEQPVVNVLLVAARRNMLEQLITVLGASKLQVVDIDASVLSVCRGLAPMTVGKKYALLNMTDDILNFLVIKDSEISMVRSITIPERAADAVKSVFSQETETVPQEDLEAVGSMLASETNSSVSYYAMQNMAEPIEQIYFVSAARDAGTLAKTVADAVYTIPVDIPTLYTEQNLGLSQDVVKEFAGCIGLAMQALEG